MRPNAIISVAVCSGVRMKSQIEETTRPNAKPDRPATSAPANVAKRKIGSSRGNPSMCSLQQVRAALEWDRHFMGRLQCPRTRGYANAGPACKSPAPSHRRDGLDLDQEIRTI